MGKDPSPWVHLLHSPWQLTELNSASKLNAPGLGNQNTNPMVFSAYSNHCRYTHSETMPDGFGASKFLQSPAINLPLDSMNVPSGATGQKRFLIFDQSGDHTSLIYSSVGPPFWSPNTTEHKPKPSNQHGFGVNLPVFNDPINWSDGTNVSDGHEGDEMHEDTEEIDALLYSDSEDDNEEEASTGHSPIVETVGSVEEVASSAVPSKRRRLDEEEVDASVMDTASSARVSMDYEVVDDRDESSCVKGRAEGGTEEQYSPKINSSNKRLKRERIHEIVGLLRRIIPGGKGKDATVVLDEAIRYLRYLKLKAKS